MPAPNASGFNIAMGAVLAFMGVMVGFVGIMGMIGEGLSGIGWVMGGMAFGGVLMVVGGIQMFRDGRSDRTKQQEVSAAAKEGHAHAAIPDVLAEWPLDARTWNAFTINEKKYRNRDNIWFFVAFIFLGTLTLMLSRDSTFLLALSIAAVIGLITVIARRTVALQKLQVPSEMPRSVVVGRRHIILNGKLYPINADRMTTRKGRLIRDGEPAILELTLYWPTRNGETFDELRIPVPPDAIAQAEYVITQLFPHNPQA